MTTIATICARGNSEGIPKKNIKLLDGKPLIVHTIEQARKSRHIDAVYVSTDSPEIARIASEAGARVPYLRPPELSTADCPKHPVIEHLVKFVEEMYLPVDMIVDLQPTSPLRTVEDISACVRMLDDQTDVVITAYESDTNPYFNMVEYKPEGLRLVKGDGSIPSRQSAPTVYTLNGSIYVWNRNTLDKGLWGRTKVYLMPRDRSIDIDTELDFKICEMLMKERVPEVLDWDG